MNRWAKILGISLLLNVGGSAAVLAEEPGGSKRWGGKIWVQGEYQNSIGDNDGSAGGAYDIGLVAVFPGVGSVPLGGSGDGSVEVELNSSPTLNIGGEVWYGNIGVEVDLYYYSDALTIGVEGAGLVPFSGRWEDDVSFWLASVGANYHVRRWEGVDLYFGPILTPGVYSFSGADALDPSVSVGWGAKLGLDYSLSSRWSLTTSVKYIDWGELDFDYGFGSDTEGIQRFMDDVSGNWTITVLPGSSWEFGTESKAKLSNLTLGAGIALRF